MTIPPPSPHPTPPRCILLASRADVFVVKRYWEQGNRIWAICDAAIIAVSILVSFILFTWSDLTAALPLVCRFSLACTHTHKLWVSPIDFHRTICTTQKTKGFSGNSMRQHAFLFGIRTHLTRRSKVVNTWFILEPVCKKALCKEERARVPLHSHSPHFSSTPLFGRRVHGNARAS